MPILGLYLCILCNFFEEKVKEISGKKFVITFNQTINVISRGPESWDRRSRTNTWWLDKMRFR